jgi:hypothetical protein
MPAYLMEQPRRIAEVTVSAMLATAGMVVFEVPQALFKLLEKISLYSFVLTFHLAFVIYHSTKQSSDGTRGSRKPQESEVSTRDYRFSPIKHSSGVLNELISPHGEGDNHFVANTSCPRLRSSTVSSEFARNSSSTTSVATLVEVSHVDIRVINRAKPSLTADRPIEGSRKCPPVNTSPHQKTWHHFFR